MILSAHSCLGKGCAVENRRATLKTDFAKQDVNIVGNTWTTRWLLGVLPKGYYDAKKGDTDAYDRMTEALVDDMNEILANGCMSATGEKFWLAVISVIGDWPFHQKTFHLTRTFGSVAKRPSSQTASKGICMHCLADQSGYPWEDFESANPNWRSTVGVSPPFGRDPIFLQLPHDPEMPTSIMGMDLFHGFHLGAGKVFVSSCLVLVSEEMEGSSVPKRFEQLHDVFFDWCQKKSSDPTSNGLARRQSSGCKLLSFPVVPGQKDPQLLAFWSSSLTFARSERTVLEGKYFRSVISQLLKSIASFQALQGRNLDSWFQSVGNLCSWI